MSGKPVICLTGPTASGKSTLALALAERLGGVIINADSMQVYRELAVLTARPGRADLARAPHYLYGEMPGDAACSAAHWAALARARIEAAHAADMPAILVGGTGLYFRALLEGLSPMPAIPDAVRRQTRALLAADGARSLHDRLAAVDPESAAKLNPADSQRVARAFEVYQATGRPLAAWQKMPPRGGFGTTGVVRAILQPPRAVVYQRVDARFDAMIDSGAVDEVRALLALNYDPRLPVMKAVGVRELAACLAGEVDFTTATEQAKTASRRYAKRQMTWFRNQFSDWEWFSENYLENFLRLYGNFIT